MKSPVKLVETHPLVCSIGILVWNTLAAGAVGAAFGQRDVHIVDIGQDTKHQGAIGP